MPAATSGQAFPIRNVVGLPRFRRGRSGAVAADRRARRRRPLPGFGVEVIYTGQSEDESAESELVRDMLAIVTSFAGRLYGQRSAKTKRLRAAVAAETECGDAA